jgi:hypothetical protein
MSRRSMEVEVKVPRVADATREVRALASAVKELRMGSGSAIFSPEDRRALSGLSNIRGSSARLSDANRRLEFAQRSGNESWLFDAQVSQRRALRAHSRDQELLNGPSLRGRAETWLRSTRFGAGGTMPLVGRTLDMMEGASPAAARIALPALAAAAGLKLLGERANAAAESIGIHGAAVSATGGTSSNIARLGAAGVDASQAAAFRQTLISDALAAMTAARLGIGPKLDPRLGGDQNLAGDMVKAMDGLREVLKRQGPNEQLRVARILGMEGDLNRINVSGPIWSAQRQDAALAARVRDERSMQMARDFDAQGRRLDEAGRTLGDEFGKMLLPTFGAIKGRLADMTNAFTRGLNEGNQFTNRIDEFFATGGVGAPKDLRGPKMRRGNPGGVQFDQNMTVVELLSQLQNPIGGGARARGSENFVFEGDRDPRAGVKADRMRAAGFGAFSGW